MSEKLTTRYDVLDRNAIERIGLTKEDLDIILKASLEMARQEVSIDEGIEIIKYGKMLDPIYGEDGCAVCRPKNGGPATVYCEKGYYTGPVVMLSDVIDKCEESGGRLLGTIHTHAFGMLRLSEADLRIPSNERMDFAGLAVCIRRLEDYAQYGVALYETEKLPDPEDVWWGFAEKYALGMVIAYAYYVPSKRAIKELAEEKGISEEEAREALSESAAESPEEVELIVPDPNRYTEFLEEVDRWIGKPFLRLFWYEKK